MSYRDILTFNVFDPITNKLLYTKYNFNFILYSSSRNLNYSLSKTEIFKEFLKENGTTFDKPYTLISGLERFFTPITQKIIDYVIYVGNIHCNYMSFSNPSTYVSTTYLIDNQFDLVDYNDTQIRFIQDYTYTTNSNNLDFTKYNFDFDTYSKDFIVFGTKLLIFTDFVIRCAHLSNATYGYGLPEQFVKYFIVNNEVGDYLVNYGISSNNLKSYKNPANIDFISYGKLNPDLTSDDVNILKDHYYKYGQFELRPFNFIPSATILKNSDLIINSVASIFSIDGSTFSQSIASCSGFLYSNGDGNIYLVSCYHIIANEKNVDVLRASFGITSNATNVQSSTTTADFTIIGYDIMADVIVCLFDPTLPYNSINNVDLSSYRTIQLNFDYSLNKGDNVFFLGNVGDVVNNGLISADVMNENYNGNMLASSFSIGSPDSILLDSQSISGLSGSPILTGDPEGTDGNITCVGMINSRSVTPNETASFPLGIQSRILLNIINNIIENRTYYNSDPIISKNTILTSYLLKFSNKKSWFGTICCYFNSSISIKKYPILNNFPYTGGLIVEDFILGFNIIEKKYITDVAELGDFSTIKINTPLLNTKMYNRFIESSKTPIVIKSFQYFNRLTSEYNKFNVGIYGNQVSYSKVTYGLLPIFNKPLTIPDADTYLFPTYEVYPKVQIEYYYYNGRNWILEKEVVGGDDPSNYSTYTDEIGNKFYQHNFILPYTLYNYASTYEDGKLLGLDFVAIARAIIKSGVQINNAKKK